MKKNILLMLLSATTMLFGCASNSINQTTNNVGEWKNLQAEKQDAALVWQQFQGQFEQVLAYSHVIGKKVSDTRVMGIARYPLKIINKTPESYLVSYQAKCPVGYFLDARGTVIKPIFEKNITMEEMSDCQNLLNDYKVFVQTGKTIDERVGDLQIEYLKEAKKHKGTSEYFVWLNKAAAVGSVEAQYLIGINLIEGKNASNKDIENGLNFLKKAAYGGHGISQYLLGKYYLRKKGSADNLALSYALFKASSKQKTSVEKQAKMYLELLSKELNEVKNGESVIRKGEQMFESFQH